MTVTGFERASSLLERHQRSVLEPTEFVLLDRTWELLPGVFNPTFTPVTTLFTRWLRYPVGGTFLEVGSGTGVTAVSAALYGCRSVTALDISGAAVANTRRNAARHGVSDQVRVLRSDLFDALDPRERFDLIYWNSNFVEPPEGFVNESELHHAFFDPDYEAHRRFIQQAPAHLTRNGRLQLGFSSIGNFTLLRRMCAQEGLEIQVLRAQHVDLDPTTGFEFQLLELRPT